MFNFIDRSSAFYALLIGAAILLAGTEWAMWFAFGVAAYSAFANDSIQTLGTFLSSNHDLDWKFLWFVLAAIMIATHTYGWVYHSGDIAYGRLSEIPHPRHLSVVHLLVPIALLVMTRMCMPVSTTFLLLSTFSDQVVIEKMLHKTLLGYGLSFVFTLMFWLIIGALLERMLSKDYNKRVWRVAQFLITGALWHLWLIHDTANIAVFLPRALGPYEFAIAMTLMAGMLAMLVKQQGGSIQCIITRKTQVRDVRQATIIDFVYTFILLYFKKVNNIPMSTTWIFLGLMAGREVALNILDRRAEDADNLFNVVSADVFKALVGLVLSLLIAFAAGI